MASASEEPRRLEPGDVDRAARVFARAFAWHEPWGDWAMPDPTDREERIYARFRSDLLERFIPYGECWTIGAGAATTMWIPPGVAAAGEPSQRVRLRGPRRASPTRCAPATS